MFSRYFYIPVGYLTFKLKVESLKFGFLISIKSNSYLMYFYLK